jgi:hypothetical protein
VTQQDAVHVRRDGRDWRARTASRVAADLISARMPPECDAQDRPLPPVL